MIVSIPGQNLSLNKPGACWSCRGPAGPRPVLFCETCGAIQGPGQLDHFALLDLPRGFVIDGAALEQAYFKLQSRLHPDRFVARAERERLLSMQQSANVNEAYETLKSPLSRAEYLLILSGVTVNAETGNLPTDPDTLMEAMSHREALEEAEDSNALQLLVDDVVGSAEACEAALQAAFEAEDVERATGLTTRYKYLLKFIEEARRKRRTLQAA